MSFDCTGCPKWGNVFDDMASIPVSLVGLKRFHLI